MAQQSKEKLCCACMAIHEEMVFQVKVQLHRSVQTQEFKKCEVITICEYFTGSFMAII